MLLWLGNVARRSGHLKLLLPVASRGHASANFPPTLRRHFPWASLGNDSECPEHIAFYRCEKPWCCIFCSALRLSFRSTRIRCPSSGSQHPTTLQSTHVDVWYLLKFYVRQLYASVLWTPITATLPTLHRTKGSRKTIPARFWHSLVIRQILQMGWY